MSAFSAAEWQSINTLGHAIDDDLERLQVGLTMGGEPTYVSATDLASLQWRYQALGDDKRELGERLLQRLQRDLAPVGSLLHNGVGKLYPAEPFPRWALGCFWREDGLPLWQHPEWLTGSPTAGLTWQAAKAFTEKLTEVLGISFESAMVARDGDTLQPVGFVLPILPVDIPTGRVWASCSWKFAAAMEDVVLVPGLTPAGMRLPLGQLKAPTELVAEAQGSLQDAPIQAARHPYLVSDNRIQVALCIEVRQGRLRVFVPPLMAVRGYVDLLAAVEQVACALQQPILLEGYRPPLNQGIQGFQITPDPGVLEVNIHPAASWAELVDLHRALDQAAVDCGLGTVRYERDGRSIDTGGGAHITLGARRPEESPLLRRPDLLRSFITYWQHHPSLSYLFAGQFVGPTSQSPRIDEAGPDCLEQLEMAFALLQPDAPLPPEMVDYLLHHLLVDVTGSAHRAAFCIDKLYPTNNLPQRLGLLELRGFAMPPDGQMRLLQMLLVRACVAWFWQVPYCQPFKRWGKVLHDQFLLPHYIQTDLTRVLQDLNQAGYGFEDAWFQPFLDFRCPIYGQVQLADYELELRHALEPWPVLANETDGSGSSRPVDDTTERLQVKLRRSEPSEPLWAAPMLVCNGQRVPLHRTDNPGEFVAGIRYRVRSYIWDWITPALGTVAPRQQQKLAQLLQPVSSLRFELFDGDSLNPLGGCLYQVPQSKGGGWPTTAEEAQRRRCDRIISLAPYECNALPKTPPVLNSPPKLHLC